MKRRQPNKANEPPICGKNFPYYDEQLGRVKWSKCTLLPGHAQKQHEDDEHHKDVR